MVQYQIPKPPQGFIARAKNSMRLATAYMKGDKTTISDITSETVFSPLQPLTPFSPQVTGRTWDYQAGTNIQFQPRGYGSGRLSFAKLREISLSCELLRLGIETVKDQISSFGWQFVPREDSKWGPEDKRIEELTQFFRKPDKIQSLDSWIRMALEEFIVTDALSIYRPKDRVGRPYAFEILDSQTIKPLIDADGRRPMPPDPAFQQIIRGAPRVNYTQDELLYAPRNLLSYNPLYGYSIVETVLISAHTSLYRAKYQQAYFTEGSVPDAFGEMPAGMTPDQIATFEDRFNNILSGNAGQRKQVPMLPSGSKIVQMKEPIIKDMFDEWLARIICFSLGLAPTAFIHQNNRATADSEKERATSEGQGPKIKYIKEILDELIADFGPEYAQNVEASVRETKNPDQNEQSTIEDRNVRNATATINEVRAGRGLDPIEGGDVSMFATANGYVPLDSFEQNQATQAATMDAQAKAKAEAQANGNQPSNEPEPNEKIYGRVGKAVRHKPIPLAASQSHMQRHH
jgi:hypothetical protein